jgi:branched-chain amino acid transport system substrate-binding protein
VHFTDRHRRRIALLAFAAVLTLVIAACGSSGSSGSSNTSASGNKSPIKIGALYSQTGINAIFSTDFQKSANLVFSQVNAAGGINGHKLAITTANDASDPTTGVEAGRKMLDSGINVFYGVIWTPVGLAFANIIKQQPNAVWFTPALISPQLTDPVIQNIFAGNATTGAQAQTISKLVASGPHKKIGFIEEADTYGQEAETNLKTALSADGLSISTSTTISATPSDATAQIQQMQRAGVDFIISGVTSDAAIAIINSMEQLGVKTPIATFGGGISTPIDKLLTTSAPLNYYVVNPLACPLNGSCMTAFTTAYKAKYGALPPDIYAAQGYFEAQAFVAALKRSPNFTAKGVEQGFEGLTFSSPMIGTHTMNFSSTDHLGLKELYMQGYNGGKLDFFGETLNKNVLK